MARGTGQPSDTAGMGLAELIAPLSVSAFVDDHWERRSLVQAGDPGRFADLFDLRHVGRLLHYLKPSAPEGMLLVRDNQHYARRWTNADGTPRPSHVRAALREGYSLVVNRIDTLWEPVERFALRLQADLHHPVNVNLYVTPPGEQAFAPHWDVTDVFVLQVAGRKTWQLREAAVDRPLPDEHSELNPDTLPPLVFEGDVEAGGILYIPRGHVHSARTTDCVSIHLSVSVHPRTWLDLLSAAINSSRADSRLRAALPPGYFNSGTLRDGFAELASALPGMLHLQSALGRMAQDWLVGRPPPPGNDFLEEAPAMSADTIVRVRDGIICHVFESDGQAGIIYSGGRLAGPAKIGRALHALCAHRRSAIRDLDPGLSEREALVLATRLVRDGLLEIERGPLGGG